MGCSNYRAVRTTGNTRCLTDRLRFNLEVNDMIDITTLRLYKNNVLSGLKAALAGSVLMLAGCATSGNGPFVAAEQVEAEEDLSLIHI